MPYLIALSYLLFLNVLIKITLSGRFKYRFLIKALTCLHYLLIGFWATSQSDFTLRALWIVFGLMLSYLGDLALGLKHWSKLMLVFGFIFFAMALCSYILYFGITATGFWFSIPLIFVISLFALIISDDQNYQFKGMGKWALSYGLILALMLGSALAIWVKAPTLASTMRAGGAVAFAVSDMTLLHLYFYSEKKPGYVWAYLILYHLGQSLIALSLWAK